jgi:hypothetical protein
VGNIARSGDSRGVYRGLWGNVREDNLEDPGLDGRIMLRWIFRKLDVKALTAPMWISWQALVNAVMNIPVP